MVQDVSTEEVVAAARSGDQAAWRELVRRHSKMVWMVARSYGLSQQDTEDATQTAWLLLTTHIREIKDPAAVGGWLTTTVRRESLQLLRRRRREFPADPGNAPAMVADPTVEQGDEAAIRAELRAIVRSAFERLPQRCKELLRLLIQDPPLSYSEICQVLDIPRGSIGPTRARCLARLRRIMPL